MGGKNYCYKYPHPAVTSRMVVNRLKERICFEPIGVELLPEIFTMSASYRMPIKDRFNAKNIQN